LLKYVIVGIGGCIGSIARFWVGSYIGATMGTRFPYGTFVINISGSFLIGLSVTLLTAKANLSPNWRYFIPVGLIGGYTTFSTFEFETLRSVQEGLFVNASLNVVLSVLLGFIAVWAGVVAGRAVP
jgi:fluoride exporter